MNTESVEGSPVPVDLEARRAAILRLEDQASALEPDAPARRELADAVVGHTEAFLADLPKRPAYEGRKAAASRLAELPIAETGHALDQVLALFDEAVTRPGLLPSSGGHMAYIPGGGIVASAYGDLLAAITNEYAGVRFAGPGAVQMENRVLDWMADLVGYPAGHAGNLASGGSIANLIALVTAREATGLRAAETAAAVVYMTDHVHHCLDKALRIAGLGEVVVRRVPLDDRFRMRADALATLVVEDRQAGLRPWLVVGSAGTTDVGAIDPLDAIADVAETHGLWYHVDAAYGGFFMLVDELRPRLAGMGRSDSIVLDPHKGMFLPYGTGAVLVRDGAALQAAHAYDAAYMQDTVAEEARFRRSPAELSPELTKHFRGARVWLPLMLHGVSPFRACLAEKLELARYFHRRVADLGFEVGPEPELSVVTYRWVPESGDANQFNERLVDHVHADGRVFLSSTMIDGRFTLRMAALAFRTHLDTVDLAIEILTNGVRKLGGRLHRC